MPFAATVRMVPKMPLPPGASVATVTLHGRVFSAAPGSFIDVGEADAFSLEGTFIRVCAVGPTSQRPAYPPNAASDPRIYADPVGLEFLDVSINKVIRCAGGGVWVDPTTGASV